MTCEAPAGQEAERLVGEGIAAGVGAGAGSVMMGPGILFEAQTGVWSGELIKSGLLPLPLLSMAYT